MLDCSLFRNQLCEKINIAGSFLFCLRVVKPWIIAAEIKVSDWLYVGREESLENKLTDILINIFTFTESSQDENLD